MRERASKTRVDERRGRKVHRETPTEARGLIEVSTFKGGERCPAPAATLFIYATFNYGRETAKLIAPAATNGARDSRRYLHANSFETRFRTRKNPHRDESRPYARARHAETSVSRDVLPLLTFDLRFSSAFHLDVPVLYRRQLATLSPVIASF